MPPARPRVLHELVADPDHGSLPLLLLGLTALTGAVDAVSILALGRVFVANMTGNVVFVGFAVAGAPGFSLPASVSALAGFLVGARTAGRLVRRLPDRTRLLAVGAWCETLLVAAAFVLAATVAPLRSATTELVAALLAVALGLQNGVVRRLAVPDLTTTVLTLTLTGIAADLHTGRDARTVVRRTLAVLTMLAGAVAGAALVLRAGPRWALLLALGLVTVVAAGATVTVTRRQQPRGGER